MLECRIRIYRIIFHKRFHSILYTVEILISSYLIRGMTNKTRKLFYPKKYFYGLSAFKKTQRKKEIQRFGPISWKSPRAYVGFKTDKGVRTKNSSYTVSWRNKYPDAKSLEEKAEASGVPLRYIKESYNRGMAAWRTGHRPGATQQQWGYARVHSFLLCGKTYHTTDSDIVREAKQNSPSAKRWWAKQRC